MLRGDLEMASLQLIMSASSYILMMALIILTYPGAACFAAASADSETKAKGSSPLYSSGNPTPRASATRMPQKLPFEFCEKILDLSRFPKKTWQPIDRN
jgi:hypothetical protein